MSSDVLNAAAASLNRAQKEAVDHAHGPILVLAGAGSGKTRVLTMRIVNLIERHGVDPANILAVTFTNKAAGEMKDRLARLTGAAPPGMWVGTFHSIGARLLRMHAAEAGRTQSFTIYDSDDTVSLIKRVVEARGIRIGDINPRAIAAAISDASNRMISPPQYASLARDNYSRTVAEVYSGMEQALRAANAATFDDLLTLPVGILSSNSTILAHYQDRFRFILVDEYQDTNHAQYRLITMLGARHRNVCVVGDDDQSIYGWRGADVRNILSFEKDFPGAAIVRLEDNYRSTPSILKAANAIISHNADRRGKTLRATLPAGEDVTLTAALDERDEAEWIAEEISSRRARDMSMRLSDVAIIYRTNAQSRAFEEVFRRRSIAYRLVGTVGFFERREVKDLLAYLRLIANPADDVSFLRAVAAPRRGIGTTSLEHLGVVAREAGLPLLAAASSPALLAQLRPAARAALGAFAALMQGFSESARDTPVPELLSDLIQAVGYMDFLRGEEADATERIENIGELISSAGVAASLQPDDVPGTPLDFYLQQVSLVAGLDALDPNADAVTLMTVHNAKGLEFPVVFISGLEDGLFPLAKAFDDPPLLEEERRLLYVGVTRAERKLYLTHAASRRRNGELRQSIVSSFIRDAGHGLWEERPTMRYRSAARAGTTPSYSTARRATYGVPAGADRRKMTDDEISQVSPVMTNGTRVRHAMFGTGTVSDISGTGRDAKVTVEFDDETIGRKRLVVAYAGLESGWDE